MKKIRNSFLCMIGLLSISCSYGMFKWFPTSTIDDDEFKEGLQATLAQAEYENFCKNIEGKKPLVLKQHTESNSVTDTILSDQLNKLVSLTQNSKELQDKEILELRIKEFEKNETELTSKALDLNKKIFKVMYFNRSEKNKVKGKKLKLNSLVKHDISEFLYVLYAHVKNGTIRMNDFVAIVDKFRFSKGSLKEKISSERNLKSIKGKHFENMYEIIKNDEALRIGDVIRVFADNELWLSYDKGYENLILSCKNAKPCTYKLAKKGWIF